MTEFINSSLTVQSSALFRLLYEDRPHIQASPSQRSAPSQAWRKALINLSRDRHSDTIALHKVNSVTLTVLKQHLVTMSQRFLSAYQSQLLPKQVRVE
jgi:hypothetical protein